LRVAAGIKPFQCRLELLLILLRKLLLIFVDYHIFIFMPVMINTINTDNNHGNALHLENLSIPRILRLIVFQILIFIRNLLLQLMVRDTCRDDLRREVE
jgi:hypothetical protein